eukprot:sb/3474897/
MNLDTVGPRFIGRIKFPRYEKIFVFWAPRFTGLNGQKPFPPSNPVNRGPTVLILTSKCSISGREKENNDREIFKQVIGYQGNSGDRVTNSEANSQDSPWSERRIGNNYNGNELSLGEITDPVTASRAKDAAP